MQNLILFLRKYNHFFLFILLEIFCFYAIFRFNTYHNSVLLNASNSVSGSILQSQEDVLQYLSLEKENERLLMKSAQDYTWADENKIMIGSDTFVVTDTTGVPLYSFIPAKVLEKTIRKRSNYFIINRGRKHGVAKDMGVVSQDGVVGIVVNSTQNFSTVMPLLHEEFSLTPRIRNEEQYGKLFWEGPDPRYAKIDRVSKHIPLTRGMEVRTSLFSRYFPPNYMVGRIIKLKEQHNSSYWDIRVKLSTDFMNVRSVYVVKNNFKLEVDSLRQAQ